MDKILNGVAKDDIFREIGCNQFIQYDDDFEGKIKILIN